MANSHVAHNCHLGDLVILANGVLLAGYAVIGGSGLYLGELSGSPVRPRRHAGPDAGGARRSAKTCRHSRWRAATMGFAG